VGPAARTRRRPSTSSRPVTPRASAARLSTSRGRTSAMHPRPKVTCAVATGPRDGGGFGIAVNLQIEERNIDQTDLARFVREAHEKVCPYSHATRGNVPVTLEVIGK